jgi:NDP-sugar pyrophosphorylase family protein
VTLRAVILAGGAGTRLGAETATLPKPLVRIGGGPPLVEIILGQLARAGVEHVTLALHHLADQLARMAGRRHGVTVDCSVEEHPLGSAGPLTLIRDLPGEFLVVNGDILTDLDPAALLRAHHEAGNDLTIATCRHVVPLRYGVVERDGGRVTGFRERPVVEHEVNMGLYVMRRAVVDRLPRGEPCGMDRLIGAALAAGDRVGAHRHGGYWRDIGAPDDRARADADWPALEARLG